ncbi:histidinol-phosphate transaminase [Bacillus carboniphilus]|uniref:Histidinol-phosphate aminotransferase n=1 Tax=Bacillus carboniphilus TaxID=86663 RepID=A0ABY9K1K8_9BACI|nr:histidinol-phosphate transaminase [Bacillus carboniphilus]WLR43730.1 histidinol-phosphate transaminase [Bacillus carboniphilus]
MEIKQQLKSLTPYKPGKPIEEVKRELHLDKVVKLASNENPYGCSPKVREAIMDEVNLLAIYPDGYSADLRRSLANYLHIEEGKLIFGNGSDEVVQILCRSLLQEGFNTVMATPTFPQYKHNSVIEGAEIREVPLKDGDHDLKKMVDQIDENTKIFWICSPNNPTGTYVNEDKLKSTLKKIPSHVLVVVDEAYYEYVQVEDYPNTLSLLEEFDNLFILRTFSKAYGLAALRIGYGIGHANIIQAIEPTREPFNTNRLAQVAAKQALLDQSFIQSCTKKNRIEKQRFYDFCSRNHLSYCETEGNFILIDFKRDSDELFQALLEQGYIVRSGKALGFNTSLRITFGTKEQNEEIIKVLEEILSQKNSD